jgi:parallel beta-helix repeat protein
LIDASGANGIYLSGNKMKVVNNTVIGSQQNGIYIAGATGCVITGNIVDCNRINGLVLGTGCYKNIVTSNNLIGNTGTNYIDNGTGTVASLNITA